MIWLIWRRYRMLLGLAAVALIGFCASCKTAAERMTQRILLRNKARRLREVELRILADGDGDSPSEIRNLSESQSNLFSSAELARELLEVVSDFEKQLAGVLEKSEKTETAEEHRKFKLATGAVLYELGQQLLFPVFRRHKDLIPEELKGELL